MRRIRSVLEERDFRVLLTGQFVAQAADGMAQAVFADRLILEPVSAGTPERILALFAITLVPYSGLAPFLGVFVDRWPRRALMAWANALRAVILMTLPLWAAQLPSDSGLFVGVIALLGLGRLFLTTKGASLPTVLHERFLLRGNAISSGGGMISALLGGVVGLAAVEVTGANQAFVLAGAAYAAAAFALGRLSQPMAHPHPDPGRIGAEIAAVARELSQGLVEIARRARARLPIIGVFIVRSVGMLVTIAAILVIKDLYDTDSTRRLVSAIALGAAGAGAFTGASIAPLLGRNLPKAGLIIAGFCASGLGIVALGGIENLPALLVLTFVGGFGTFVAIVAVDAQVQEALPDEFRGRAFAVYDILYNLASVVAAAVMVAAATISLRALLVTAGTITLIVAALLGLAMKRAGMFARPSEEAPAGSP